MQCEGNEEQLDQILEVLTPDQAHPMFFNNRGLTDSSLVSLSTQFLSFSNLVPSFSSYSQSSKGYLIAIVLLEKSYISPGILFHSGTSYMQWSLAIHTGRTPTCWRPPPRSRTHQSRPPRDRENLYVGILDGDSATKEISRKVTESLGVTTVNFSFHTCSERLELALVCLTEWTEERVSETEIEGGEFSRRTSVQS